MPQRKSALKRLRADEKRRARNLSVKKKLKDVIKKFLKAIKNSDLQAAEEQLKAVYKELDKSAAKKVIHKNKAARKKSRLKKKLAASSAKKAQ